MQQSKYYGQLALQRWRSRPWALTMLGFCRILHGLGFSFRGYYDYMIALFTIISIAASVALWKWGKYPQWVLVFWTATLLYAAQAFVFMGDIRFKIVVVDLSALFVFGLFCFEWIQRHEVRPRGAQYAGRD